MNRNKFTKRVIQILKNNLYTYRVTESQLFFTKDFKEEFWKRYQAGDSTRRIRVLWISNGVACRHNVLSV